MQYKMPTPLNEVQRKVFNTAMKHGQIKAQRQGKPIIVSFADYYDKVERDTKTLIFKIS